MKTNRWKLNKESLDFLASHVKIDKEILLSIEKHLKKHKNCSKIVAYYTDFEDFCKDWCSIGYTRKEAKNLLYGKDKFPIPGEFLILLDQKGIIRFM